MRKILAMLSLGVGLPVSVVVGAVSPTMAFADSTCYTGCSAPGSSTTEPLVVTPVANDATSPASGGLPFTGADLAEMSAVGGGLLVAGAVVARRGRRSRSATGVAKAIRRRPA
jgi:hypothetical protein